MIRIIKGIYGYKNTDGVIEPKTCKDKPFSLTEEQENRLVSIGVAEYVEVAPVQPQEDEKKTEKNVKKQKKSIVKEQIEKASDVVEGNEEPPVLNPEDPQ